MNLDYIRKELIPKLIEKDLLALTIPDKPRSPHQTYTLTEAGRKCVQAGKIRILKMAGDNDE
jgi:hypothetical protein